MFHITSNVQNTAILHAQGKIIGTIADQLQDAIELQLQNGNNKLILDLKDVPLLDSTALGVIILAFQVVQRSGGKLVLLNPQKAVNSILEVTRLKSILEVYETEEAAYKAVV